MWEELCSIRSCHHRQCAGADRGIAVLPLTVNEAGREARQSRHSSKQSLITSYYSPKTLCKTGFCSPGQLLAVKGACACRSSGNGVEASCTLAMSTRLDLQTRCNSFDQAGVIRK